MISGGTDLDDDLAARVPSPAAAVPSAPAPCLPTHLGDLTDRARTYVAAASSANTRKAYAANWKHFSA